MEAEGGIERARFFFRLVPTTSADILGLSATTVEKNLCSDTLKNAWILLVTLLSAHSDFFRKIYGNNAEQDGKNYTGLKLVLHSFVKLVHSRLSLPHDRCSNNLITIQ